MGWATTLVTPLGKASRSVGRRREDPPVKLVTGGSLINLESVLEEGPSNSVKTVQNRKEK